ncbi:5'-methylthioadenosine/S-adenosylhomocysteine nucleosidase family protein [Pseudoalteromonas sp. T1lg24]|uniref:5'-methylthioadenosine/S-adenosylhomocysteine nucleosidase family protein n=1 Tax=Pseudoalteromonas sp. T1lg24 TaxID=2077099 RepID=UPI000CF6620B|nr:response regulator [Pseudoalteromonas sp. T1lg24]
MINVIIIDDCPKKIEVIKEGLNIGVKYNLDIAKTVNEALTLFSEKIYDFAVIDLALPKRKNEDPVPNAGIELIKEVNELDWYKKPKFSIAITQHEGLKNDYKQSLEDCGVIIYHYDGTSNIQEYVKTNFEGVIKTSTQIDYGVDVLILTALQEEAAPLLSASEFSWYREETFGIEDIDFRLSLIGSDSNYKVALGVLPKMGLVSSSITTSRLINYLRPKLILMPGICAGVQEEVNECDLIVASPSWEWQTGKWKGEEFAIEPYQITVDQRLINKAKELEETNILKKFWQQTEHKRPEKSPRLHIGPMVTGSSVISNAEKMSELRTQHRKLLGLEMEIFGMYSACVMSHIKPLFLGYKSVCDFGNEQKGDSYHGFCSEVSAKFTIELINIIKPILNIK